jgi:glycosyltransferase involved in cell wall biosynthesis
VTGPRTVPTVAVAMHDGFYSCGTGAGRSNRGFLEALAGFLRPGVRLTVLPIHLAAASSEYDPAWHAAMHSLIHRADGEDIPVDNGSGGQVRFGGLDNFRAACESAAGVTNQRILPNAGSLLILAFDTPFYGLAHHLAPAARASLIVVARSTGALHSPGDQARVAWERSGLHATAAAGGRIAAISVHMREHLVTTYAIPHTALLDLPNGLTRADWHTRPPDAHLLPARAERGFIFAMGRAVAYKGFDDLIDALALLKADGVTMPHVLIAAVTDNPQLTAYQRHLASSITAHRLDATLITRFTPGLRNLLAHPALAAVIVPSRAEPFGRIPLEGFAAGAAPVVSTTAGGLAELVTNGQTGYTAAPGNPPSLAGALRAALACNPADRARMRAAGRQIAATRFNYEVTVAQFFAATAPWAVDIPPRSRASADRIDAACEALASCNCGSSVHVPGGIT